MNTGENNIRLDKWLWVARFYKTRQIAATAIKSGKVRVNTMRSKPARLIDVGDRLMIEKDGFNYEVDVLSMPLQRVSAKVVSQLYQETPQSIKIRKIKQSQRRAERLVSIPRPKTRPGKHDRRKLEAFKRGETKES